MRIFNEQNFGVMAGAWPLSADRPTLVFLHGAALSKQLWATQVKDLSDIANTIALDLPGHRDSKGPAVSDIFECAAAVSTFIESIAAPGPIVCGLSMGGAVAQALLLSRPEIYKSAVLMHTGARLKVQPFIFDAITKDYNQYQDLAVEFSTAETSDRAKIKTMMKAIVVTEPDVAVKDFTACDRFDVMDRLSEIRSRVLVVTGDADHITPSKYGIYLHQNIEKSRMITIAGAGHLSPLEKPEAVGKILRDFVLDA